MQGNTAILTYDFVHRTHFEVHGYQARVAAFPPHVGHAVRVFVLALWSGLLPEKHRMSTQARERYTDIDGQGQTEQGEEAAGQGRDNEGAGRMAGAVYLKQLWTTLQYDGPNHLKLWRMALITSDI